MSNIIQNFISLVRGYKSDTYRSKKLTKIKFGVPLSKLSQKTCSHLPKPLFDLLVYLAQEGVKTNDLFRRPGNSIQIKEIIELLSSGKEIKWDNYNLYTAANVVKKYLISLPGGIFGRKFETLLLASYSTGEDARRSTFHRILRQLPNANRELAILMFGILFRMVSHAVDSHNASNSNNSNTTETSLSTTSASRSGATTTSTTTSTCNRLIRADIEQMLAEAVAKSVAGSMFHLCTSSPDNVEKAAAVLKGLILDFPSFEESYVDFYYRSTMISYRDEYPNYLYSMLDKDTYINNEFEEENAFPSITSVRAAGRSGSDTMATITMATGYNTSTGAPYDATITTSCAGRTVIMSVPTFTVTNPYGDIIETVSLHSISTTSSLHGADDECDDFEDADYQDHHHHRRRSSRHHRRHLVQIEHVQVVDEDDDERDIYYDNISLGSSRSHGYDQVQARQLRRLRLRSDWFLQSSCNDLQSPTTRYHRYQHRFLSNTREPNPNSANLQHRITITTESSTPPTSNARGAAHRVGGDYPDVEDNELIDDGQDRGHSRQQTNLLMVPVLTKHNKNTNTRQRNSMYQTAATSSANISTCSGSSSFIYDDEIDDEVVVEIVDDEDDAVHFSDYH